MNGKIKKKGLSIAKVYMNDELFTSMAITAEKLKFRRAGLPIKIQKPHGFVDDWVANTDGISLLLKFTYKYYLESEPKRAEEYAKALKEREEVELKLKKLTEPGVKS